MMPDPQRWKDINRFKKKQKTSHYNPLCTWNPTLIRQTNYLDWTPKMRIPALYSYHLLTLTWISCSNSHWRALARPKSRDAPVWRPRPNSQQIPRNCCIPNLGIWSPFWNVSSLKSMGCPSLGLSTQLAPLQVWRPVQLQIHQKVILDTHQLIYYRKTNKYKQTDKTYVYIYSWHTSTNTLWSQKIFLKKSDFLYAIQMMI